MILKSRKAQFFILSAFAIVLIVYFMSRWLEPFTIIDISQIPLQEEMFLLNNIKEKSFYFAKEGTKSCDDLRYNIEEYKHFFENYALEKGYKLNFNYTIAPCYGEPPLFPVVTEIKLYLKSKNMELMAEYSVKWVPYY
jgi:hypothetical protein